MAPPIAIALVVGLLLVGADVGFLAFAGANAPYIADEAARSAVVAAGADDADARILAKVRERAAGLPGARVDRVVVYRASGPEDGPPAACRLGPASEAPEDVCSVYGAGDLTRPAAELPCRWCPEERCSGTRVGVWIRLSYRPLVVGGPAVEVSEHAVYTVAGATTDLTTLDAPAQAAGVAGR